MSHNVANGGAPPLGVESDNQHLLLYNECAIDYMLYQGTTPEEGSGHRE